MITIHSTGTMITTSVMTKRNPSRPKKETTTMAARRDNQHVHSVNDDLPSDSTTDRVRRRIM